MVAGIPHHVTQRGNRGEQVFFTDADHLRYLELLEFYSEKHGLDILAYCLMTNHLHLVVLPRRDDSLARVLKPVHLRYAQHVNWTQHQTGRLWQGRFFSCPLDEAHCLAAIRYVERNPVRARIVRKAENYRFSSAPGHVGLSHDRLLSRQPKIEAAVGDWSAWLRTDEDREAIARLRLNTRTGRPLGNPVFIARLERLCKRILRPKPAGRPRTPRRRR